LDDRISRWRPRRSDVVDDNIELLLKLPALVVVSLNAQPAATDAAAPPKQEDLWPLMVCPFFVYRVFINTYMVQLIIYLLSKKQ
jgi:hypothetical protein